MDARTGRRSAFDAWIPAGLLAIVIALFHQHLAGNLTFPWDFQGGYYTHALARMRDGSYLAPPLWLPWGGFGIPGHLSLQDGTWYLPQYVFDFFGWTYDLVGATRLQVAHVALGPIGVYALLRRLGFAQAASGIAAAAYVFTGSFYSNAQHVDIVRGAALFPWLLFGIASLLQRVTAPRVAFCVLLAWQFLVGSYPGIVVSGAYAAACLVVIQTASARGCIRAATRNFAFVGAAGMLAAGLAAVKFLPALVDTANIRQSGGQVTGVDIPLLTTLLVDFDVEFLINDVTMRDLFLPLPVLVLAVIGVSRRANGVLGMSLTILGLTVIANIDALQIMLSHLPLLRISRFQISDFRPVLHLGLCILGANGITVLLESRYPRGVVFLRLCVAAAAVLIGLVYAHSIGHPVARMYWPMVSLVATVLVCGWWCLRRPVLEADRVIGLTLLVAATLGSGVDHVLSNARVWKSERSDAAEIHLYGRTITELASVNRFDALTNRPERMVLTALPSERGMLYDARYNLGWIAEGFSAFGYEDLKGSEVFRQLYESASPRATGEQTAILQWLVQPSSIMLVQTTAAVTIDTLQQCVTHQCRPDGVPAATGARMEAFRENGAVYSLSVSTPLTLVENEPWYPGWKSIICTIVEGCGEGPSAVPVNGVLRAWSVPHGDYRLITYFEPPMWHTARSISWIAAVLSLLLIVGTGLVRNMSNRERAPKSTQS